MSLPQMPGLPAMNSESQKLSGDASASLSPSAEDSAKAESNVGLNIPSHEEKKSISVPSVEAVKAATSMQVLPEIEGDEVIEVVALLPGFYNQNRIAKDEVFNIASFKDLGSWMECTDPKIQARRLRLEAEKKKARL